VQSVESHPMFRRNISPPSSGSKKVLLFSFIVAKRVLHPQLCCHFERVFKIQISVTENAIIFGIGITVCH
jgi:hypothetical protein